MYNAFLQKKTMNMLITVHVAIWNLSRFICKKKECYVSRVVQLKQSLHWYSSAALPCRAYPSILFSGVPFGTAELLDWTSSCPWWRMCFSNVHLLGIRCRRCFNALWRAWRHIPAQFLETSLCCTICLLPCVPVLFFPNLVLIAFCNLFKVNYCRGVRQHTLCV